MSNKTAVSVVVPVYNQELFIGRCLRSLLDQTLDKESYEIVVVNDCSKDNTLPILEKFKNKIKLINNKKKNNKIYKCINCNRVWDNGNALGGHLKYCNQR